MLSNEQMNQIKSQVIDHINSTFPDDKKSSAISQIESMNEEQLEEFLIQNNMIKDSQNSPRTDGQPQQCIFCSIVEGKIPSTQIDENKDAIAVLEINPVSRGHTIIIPKQHIESKEKFPKTISELAEETSKKIKEKLKPKDVLIESSNMFGHEILNVVPVYENENLNSQRKKADSSEIEELHKLFTFKKEVIEESKIEQINADDIWLPKRFP